MSSYVATFKMPSYNQIPSLEERFESNSCMQGLQYLHIIQQLHWTIWYGPSLPASAITEFTYRTYGRWKRHLLAN